MTATTIRRLSRGVAAMAFAIVLALPVVAVEPPAASLLAWSGVVCIVVGWPRAFAVQSMPAPPAAGPLCRGARLHLGG